MNERTCCTCSRWLAGTERRPDAVHPCIVNGMRGDGCADTKGTESCPSWREAK